MKYEEKFNAVIGTSVVYNAKERDTKPVDTDTIIGNIELGMRYKGFTWDSEYYVRSKDPESDDGGDTVNSHGFYTQAGYFVIPKNWNLQPVTPCLTLTMICQKTFRGSMH